MIWVDAMDTVSKEVRSRNMAAVKAKDTKPEMKVRRILHSNGYRYSLHKKELPGKPDIYLRKYNTVIFIHGCFWHQHPGCKYATEPKSNRKFWSKKLDKNKERDKRNILNLRERGMNIITLWECEINEKSPKQILEYIEGKMR